MLELATNRRVRYFNDILLLFILMQQMSPTSSSSAQAPSKIDQKILLGTTRDPFTEAAPLIVAAVCADGVALVAAHTPDEIEPLLYFSPSNETNEQSSKEEPTFRDLPKSYGGPFRIKTIDSLGSTLLSTGWRADCDTLVEKARELAAAETRRHGSSSMAAPSGLLAGELSLFMASSAVSDSQRPLSCAALLASTNSPRLWLVDATGAYAMRAMCIGGGMHRPNQEPVAKLVQNVLRRTDFAGLTGRECISCLLEILAGRTDSMGGEPLLPLRSRLEVAILDVANRRLVRKDPSSLT